MEIDSRLSLLGSTFVDGVSTRQQTSSGSWVIIRSKMLGGSLVANERVG